MDDLLLFLVLLVITGAVWLIDRLGRAAARADQARRELEAAPPPRVPPVPRQPVPRPTRDRLRRPEPRPMALVRDLRPRARPVSLARARQAMILMAVFGPCRGLRPLEQEASSYGPPMGPISG